MATALIRQGFPNFGSVTRNQAEFNTSNRGNQEMKLGFYNMLLRTVPSIDAG